MRSSRWAVSFSGGVSPKTSFHVWVPGGVQYALAQEFSCHATSTGTKKKAFNNGQMKEQWHHIHKSEGIVKVHCLCGAG